MFPTAKLPWRHFINKFHHDITNTTPFPDQKTNPISIKLTLKHLYDLRFVGFFAAKHLSNHGKDTEAAQAMSKAASIFPENYNVIAVAADTYRKIKDYNQAELYYEQAAGLKPDLASAQMNLGAMYHLVGKYELAEKYYLKTLELSPDDKATKGNLRKLRNKVKQERDT